MQTVIFFTLVGNYFIILGLITWAQNSTFFEKASIQQFKTVFRKSGFILMVCRLEVLGNTVGDVDF